MILESELTGTEVKVTTDNYHNLVAKYDDNHLEAVGRVPSEIQEVGIHSQDSDRKAGIAQFVVQEVDGIPTLEELTCSISFLSEDGCFNPKCLDEAFNNGAK